MLAWLIHAVTGEQAGPGCNCHYRRRRMDAWGWAGSWRNRHTILRWVVEEAEGRGHVVTSDQILSLLKAAIVEARRSDRELP